MTIPDSFRKLLSGLPLCLSCLVGMNAMAAKAGHSVGKPPASYPLDEVRVQVTRQPARGGATVQRVRLTGSGSAMLERGGHSLPFRYDRKDLMTLMNAFYRMRFFEMSADTTTRYSIVLQDDGTVRTSMLRVSDASSTQVCFSVASYSKCVTYSSDPPGELESVVQQVFDEADRLTKGNASGDPAPR